MIYYSIISENNKITTVKESQINDIMDCISNFYTEKIEIYKIDVNRYKKIDDYHIEDKITGEIIYGKHNQEKLDILNKLSLQKERYNAHIRAINL